MARRSLLLLLPLALVLLLLWLQRGGDGALPPPLAADPAGEAVSATATSAIAEVGAPTATEASTARTEAARPSAGQPEIPADAKWVEVKIVDEATQEPVAGAEVGWLDRTSHERLQAAVQGEEERHFDFRDPERLAREFGWQTRGDAQGVARVHVAEWTHVVARRGPRFGELDLNQDLQPPPDGYRIELVADRTLLVQVVDQGGAPAFGVLVAIAVCNADGKTIMLWDWGPSARTGQPDGIARIAHLQGRDREFQGRQIAGHRVRLHLPGHEDPGVAFDPKDPPAEPIVLQLPPCGTVKARVEYGGRPLPPGDGWSRIGLHRGAVGDSRARNQSVDRPADADGWVRFPRVPLGNQLVASSRFDVIWLEQTFAGPLAPGQEVTVALAAGDDQIVLCGRVLDDQRQLVRNTQLEVEIESSRNSGGAQLRTDAQGRFRLCLAKAGKEVAKLRVFALTWRRQDQVALRGALPPRDLVTGEQDVGDLVLTPGRLVVAGRFLSGDEPFGKEVYFSVEQLHAREGDRGESWREVEGLTTHRQREHFEVRGEYGPGRYRLSLAGWNHLPVAPIEFTPGTEDLEVQLQRGAALQATFLLPPNMPWGVLKAALQRPGAPPAAASSDEGGSGFDRFQQDVWSQDGKRHQAQWQSLPDGSYVLEVRLWTAADPLVVIPDVIVPPPAGGDPRLFEIDLRDQIEVVIAQLVEASGKPVQPNRSGTAVAFVLPLGPGTDWRGVHPEGDLLKVATRKGPVDLLLAIPGYRPLEARGLRGSTQLVLSPWPEQEFVVRDVPPLPAGTQLELSVGPVDAPRDEGEFRTPWSSGSRSSLWQVPSRGVPVAEGGRVRLQVGDGECRLRAQLREGGRRMNLANVTPARFVPGPAPVEVRVPAESVQKALAELQKAR